MTYVEMLESIVAPGHAPTGCQVSQIAHVQERVGVGMKVEPHELVVGAPREIAPLKVSQLGTITTSDPIACQGSQSLSWGTPWDNRAGQGAHRFKRFYRAGILVSSEEPAIEDDAGLCQLDGQSVVGGKVTQ